MDWVEWNNRLRQCCCSQPECPAPNYEYETSLARFYDSSTDPLYPGGAPITISTPMRYRWLIYYLFEGTYTLIQWDEAFFPTSWDTIYGGPLYNGGTVTLTPKSYEWTGGDVVGPWSAVVPAPSSNGYIELRNIRYTCYHGTRYGQPVSLVDLPWPLP